MPSIWPENYLKLVELEQDPAPGDPEALRNLASRLQREADVDAKRAGILHQIDGNSVNLGLEGDYARVFKYLLSQLSDEASRLEPALTRCADALNRYWISLRDAQEESRRILAECEYANSSGEGALKKLNSLLGRTETLGDWRELDAEKALFLFKENGQVQSGQQYV